MVIRSTLVILMIAAIVFPISPVFGQASDKDSSGAQGKSAKPTGAVPPDGHLEVPDDPFVSVPLKDRVTSPAVRSSRDGYVSVQVNVDASGDNIVGDAANEPSLAVDPTDPSRMVIGWRQFDTISNNWRQAGWGHTTDGGETWTFPGVIEPGVFRSDPVIDADADGVFYYNSLTATEDHSDFWCHVYRSTDGGATWDAGTYAYGGDKQWQVIDRTDGIGRGNIYACWNQWYSSCSGHFTRSTDGGDSFVSCINVPGTPYWGTLAVGPDGELYISGQGFSVVKSTTAKDPLVEPVTWGSSVSVNLGGSITVSAGPNPGGLLGQAWIDVDHSDGPSRGNVYMLCSVDPPGADPLDVMFARSTDGGTTWSYPVKVNDDPGTSAWQWFGTMSVAPNGRIDAIWNDTRHASGGYDSELYYSHSFDGGQTWSENVALSESFDPHLGWPDQNKMGDYIDMTSDNVGVHIAYAATFNGEQDVYYLRISDFDCNGNGIDDAEDIAVGTSFDCNGNDIPDECEAIENGDHDVDGDVDLSDFSVFADCLAGPGTAPDPTDPDCQGACLAAFDFDTDGDVDLADFAAMQGPIAVIVPAACCLEDGSCIEVSETECLEQEGEYQGDGSDCDSVDCPQPPLEYDDCEGAVPISLGDTWFSTMEATTDGPAHGSCQYDGQTYNDIWFEFVSLCSGDLVVSTCDTADYDTDIAVYDGCACPVSDANLLGCNDDDPSCSGYTSEVVVPVNYLGCYLIRVGGYYDGDRGTGTVSLQCVSE